MVIKVDAMPYIEVYARCTMYQLGVYYYSLLYILRLYILFHLLVRVIRLCVSVYLCSVTEL